MATFNEKLPSSDLGTDSERPPVKHPCQMSIAKYFNTKASSSKATLSPCPLKVLTLEVSPKTPAQKFGIKIYTFDEIDAVIGFEKHLRIFWNNKAEEICGYKNLLATLQTKNAVQGAIHTSWIIAKSSLFVVEVDKIKL